MIVIFIVPDEQRLERLRELRAVAIERIGLEPELPRKQIGGLAVLHRRIIRHVDGLGDGPGNEGLCRRHHPNVTLD